jgi:orotate phosphoribosyltransferase
MITNEKALELLKEAGVLLEGHFLLTSGLHSRKYLQCAQIFKNTKLSGTLCRELAEKIGTDGKNPDVVAGPAIGAILMAYEVSRQFNVPNIFSEREDGVMAFRRGFSVEKGQKILVVEDVVTTGGSVKEVIELIRKTGGIVTGVGAIVDRTGGKIDFGVPFYSVLSIEVESFESENCPICKEGILPAIKPGSRK